MILSLFRNCRNSLVIVETHLHPSYSGGILVDPSQNWHLRLAEAPRDTETGYGSSMDIIPTLCGPWVTGIGT